MTETCDLNQGPQQNICDENRQAFVREFLEKKGLCEELIALVLECGITDEIVRQLECQGFQYEDIVILLKAFKSDSKSSTSCDCSYKTSTGTRSRKSNQESDYLRDNFGTILPVGLREVILRKPFDPVEYLGHWLLHYRDCEEREKRMKELEAELLEERAKLPKETASEPITCYDYCEEAEEGTETVEG